MGFTGTNGIKELLSGVLDYLSASTPADVANVAGITIDAASATIARRDRFTIRERTIRRTFVDTVKELAG